MDNIFDSTLVVIAASLACLIFMIFVIEFSLQSFHYSLIGFDSIIKHFLILLVFFGASIGQKKTPELKSRMILTFKMCVIFIALLWAVKSSFDFKSEEITFSRLDESGVQTGKLALVLPLGFFLIMSRFFTRNLLSIKSDLIKLEIQTFHYLIVTAMIVSFVLRFEDSTFSMEIYQIASWRLLTLIPLSAIVLFFLANIFSDFVALLCLGILFPSFCLFIFFSQISDVNAFHFLQASLLPLTVCIFIFFAIFSRKWSINKSGPKPKSSWLSLVREIYKKTFTKAMRESGSSLLKYLCIFAITIMIEDEAEKFQLNQLLKFYLSEKLSFLFFLDAFLLIAGFYFESIDVFIILLPLIHFLGQIYKVDMIQLGVLLLLNLAASLSFKKAYSMKKELHSRDIFYLILLVFNLMIFTYVSPQRFVWLK